MYVGVYTYIYIYIHICMYGYIYAHIYIYICVCVCVVVMAADVHCPIGYLGPCQDGLAGLRILVKVLIPAPPKMTKRQRKVLDSFSESFQRSLIKVYALKHMRVLIII